MYNDQLVEAVAQRTTRKNRQALVVDDVVYNLELLAEFLRPLGFDSTFASTIEDARIAIAKQHFDVIFLDCELPDGLGHEFASELRSILRTATPPIISMTASNEKQMRGRCLSCGSSAFIKKPLTFQNVLESLRKTELLQPHKRYSQPVRPRLAFKNIHFMAQGDGAKYLSFIERIREDLETEMSALSSAISNSDVVSMRTIFHRILSLAPLTESRPFTSVIQACQSAAWGLDLNQIHSLQNAIDSEYRIVKLSLSHEHALSRRTQTHDLCKTG